MDPDSEPEDRPVHYTWEAAAHQYETNDPDFLMEALDTLADTDPIPESVRAALVDWYRTTDAYDEAVRYVIDEAAR